jgi:putative oxidoreductase
LKAFTIIFVEPKYKMMKNKILFAVSLLFGLLFINSGLNKFFNYMPMPKEMPEKMMKVMGAFMEIGWLLPLIAIAEITGGVLFITNKFRALGAIILFPVLIGILLTHILIEPSGLPLAIVLIGIELWVIIENREKYLPMIK